MKKHIQPRYLVSCLLGATLALVGCGSNENKAPAQTESSATSTQSAAINTDKRHVNIGITAEPESLDPHKSSDSGSFDLQRQLFLGLLGTDEHGKPIPRVATSWENTDFKVWTFHLKNDIQWSNGDPLTAHDFVYSLRRLTDPNTASPYGGYLADAKVVNAQAIADGKAKPEELGVQALDDYTLQITLSEPVPYFADLMSFAVTFAIHPKTVETYGDKWIDPAHMVVSGAYALKEAVVNSHITLTRNEKYYDNANTTLDTATFYIAQGVNAVNRYKADDLDLSPTVPFDIFPSLKQELGEQVAVTPALCTAYYEFNNTKAPFDDVRVRQGMSMILDRHLIPEKVLKRGEKPTYQFTPTTMHNAPNVKPEWANQSMEERIATAKSLFKEAGFTEQNPLKFELLYTTSETSRRISAALAEEFKKLTDGVVDMSLNNQEWKVSLQSRHEGKYSMALAAWCADYNEPSTFLNTYRSTNGNNTAFYKNPEFDQLLDQTLLADVDDAKRKELYAKAEAMLQKDAPAIFSYEIVMPILIKPDLKGYPLNDPTHNFMVEDLHFVK